MGSYDTGEVSIRPRRTYSPRVRDSTPPSREEPLETRAQPVVGDYDSQLKTIVALGGGLTPDRIVHPIPDDVRDGDLTGVVKYLTGDDIATRPEDRTIVEAVQSRMQASDYRVIINQTINYHNEKMATPLTSYLTQKTQQGEEGEIKYNFADIAIVTHDEGGKSRKPLERIV